MRKLILARHAESEANKEEIVCSTPRCSSDLTDEGRLQAGRLAQQLQGEDIALCVTSQLSRSQGTAGIALAGRAVPRLVVADFNDPLAGSFEHSPVAEFNEWLAQNGPAMPPAEGESQQDAMRRYVRAYEMLISRQEEVILAIIHRLPILWLLTAIHGDASHEIDYAAPIYLGVIEVRRAVGMLHDDPIQSISY